MNLKNNKLNFKFRGNLDFYDATYAFLNDYRGEANIIKKLMIKRGIKPSEASLLDIGCGSGNLFLYLSEIKNLIGVDISKNLIKQAKNKKIRNARFICQDM